MGVQVHMHTPTHGVTFSYQPFPITAKQEHLTNIDELTLWYHGCDVTFMMEVWKLEHSPPPAFNLCASVCVRARVCICRRRCQSVCERDGGGDDRRWHHLPNISSCRFINRVKEKSKAEAQSSSKRQQNANITMKAVKYNVRAFPKAAGTIKREFKGVR